MTLIGSKIQRDLPEGPYQGAVNNTTNPPSAVNPFATIADLGGLDGSGITDYVTRWLDVDTLTTGALRDNGTNVSLNVSPSPTIAFRMRPSALNTRVLSAEHTIVIAASTAAIYGLNSAASTIPVGGEFQSFNSAAGGISVGSRSLAIGVCNYPTGVTAVGAVGYAGVNTGNLGDSLGIFACVDDDNANDNYGLFIDASNAGAGNAYIGKFTDGTEGAGKVLTSDANGVVSWQTPAADLNGIYTGSGSLSGDTEVTIGAGNDMIFATIGSNGKFAVIPTGTSIPAVPIYFKASSAGSVWIEGFNSSDGQNALTIFNSGRTRTIAEFENNGDVILSQELGVTTRARVTIGTTTPTSNSRLTVRGGGVSTGVPTAVFQNSSSLMSLQIQNNRNVGVRNMGSSTTAFNIRAVVADTVTFQVQQTTGTSAFQVRPDGVSLFRTTNSNPIGVGAAELMSGDVTTTTGTLQANMQFRMRHNPSVDGNGRVTLGYFRAFKEGTFDSIGLNGLTGEAYNNGTGAFTSAAIGMSGVLGQARNTASNTTITNMFGLEGNVQSQASVGNETTITNMGGLKLFYNGLSDTNVTNMYGILINPLTGLTNGGVTNSYGFRMGAVSVATNNWGFYIEGAARENYIQGNMSIGATIVSNSVFEVHNGDIEVVDAGGGSGVILEAPDTTRYRVTVNNSGALVIAAA